MQTFLPYLDFDRTAKCLDYRRLGKQRLEARQIYDTLINHRQSWAHHPAVLMWAGYESTLNLYYMAIIKEWLRRGFKNTMPLSLDLTSDEFNSTGHVHTWPWWFNDPRIELTHRSNLLRKNYEYYKQFRWDISDDLEYFWPVRKSSQ